ncbi:MAG: ATP-binding protein [Victivallales bacterium]|nr:ATP-binding protein [Victivallales bacterium]
MRQELTTSVYTFEDLRQGNFLYVDKTEYIWQLIRPAQGMYFLSRPRRFGKSLLVSTLKAIFAGRKELFQGLAIHKRPYKWEKYPIIHIDFSNSNLETANDVRGFLQDELSELSSTLNLPLRGHSLGKQFEYLIKDAANTSPKKKVVLLVDEYDKPILDNIANKSHCQKILKLLKGFYSNIKKGEKYTRLAFVTGVSKFCHVSLFSDLNNLTDITLDVDHAAMLGFTEDEVRRYFADRISEAAKAKGLATDELMRLLLTWYDGYRFSKADIHVCNPVSISTFFNQKYEFDNYWGTTGVTTVLFELAKTTRFNFEHSLTEPVSSLAFGAYEVENIDPLGLLWQTGYLTIREVLPGPLGSSMYRLGFPDYEVEQAFNTQLLAYYSGYKDAAMSSMVFKLTDAMQHDDVELFMETLQSFFASIPYDIRGGDEHYYQTIFFITFLLLGSSIAAESRTNEGRIDAFIRTAKAVYIFEFKLNKSAKKAVSQIIDRHYHEKFQSSGLPIRMIGVNFNSAKGRIDNWQEMPFPS